MDAAEDLVNRLRELGPAIAAQQEVVQQLAAERRALVLELRDSHRWTDQQIADAIGTTRSAVEAIRARRPAWRPKR
jgi:hypothetical protein